MGLVRRENFYWVAAGNYVAKLLSSTLGTSALHTFQLSRQNRARASNREWETVSMLIWLQDH